MAGESAGELARRQREKAERLLRSAELWERGAEGERRTGVLLEELASYGYVALHDLKWPGRPRANIDHVLVGPSGVYVIDSKNWSGRVVIGQGTLKQNGYRRDAELVSCGEAALALVQVLDTDVVSVLCLVRDEEISGRVQEVHVCTASNLHRLILSRRTILSVEQVQRIVGVLCADTPTVSSATSARPVMPQRTPRPSRARRDRSRPMSKKPRNRSKRRSEFAGFVVTVILMVGAWGVFASGDGSGFPGNLFGLMPDKSAPTAGFGQSQTLSGDGTNVSISVGAPVNAKPARADAHVKEGHRLVSVRVVLSNPGKQKWQPEGLIRWRGEDSLGNAASSWSFPGGVTKGRQLPAMQAVWPGKPQRGVIVFQVPQGQSLESVALVTGTLARSSTTWSSTGG